MVISASEFVIPNFNSRYRNFGCVLFPKSVMEFHKEKKGGDLITSRKDEDQYEETKVTKTHGVRTDN